MNIIIIASIVAAAVLVVGIILALVVTRFSQVVVAENEAATRERQSLNTSLTKGHEIPVDADPREQLKVARRLAAKRAAQLPRGANVRIGRQGNGKQPTAFDGVEEDPITAVKIAAHHGWQGVQTGFVSPEAAQAAASAPTETVAPTKSPEDLVPGEDYPYTEITDEMSPAEVRKARIANAKAKSAAVKALKEAAPAAAPAQQPAAPKQTPQAAPAAPKSEPEPGVDYEVIEITDDMDPADVRKARIANAKAKAQAMKRFKEQGGQPAQAPAASQQPAAPQEAATPAREGAQAEATIPAHIEKPDYIEITDDMEPAEVRKARIANAKAKSAFVKALKDAGIDPSTVDV
ncbi:MAG: hypothetical protein R3300_07935 [Candidatus Promineifilaceae bacterium]|nr:hypothetical protein [Candidatus Promineifilaceae bacterium]